MKEYKGYRDLKVYELAYRLAMEIFEITKTFPSVEKYALTDQTRRSSRSVPANIVEAWYKRRYPKIFVNKLIDAQGEAWGRLRFGFISRLTFAIWLKKSMTISSMHVLRYTRCYMV